MKKLFIIVLLAMSGAFSLTSCTEEVITPNDNTPTTPPPVGGGDQGGKI